MNSDSRTFNSARNLAMSVIQKIVYIILVFIGRQIFLRILTIEYLGINGLFSDVLSMLSLADLGLATAMAYSFYKPLAERDEEKLAALIGFYRKVYNIIALFITVAGLALTPFLRYIINVNNEMPYIEVYYLVALANTVISYLFVYKSIIITADQKSSIVAKYAVYIAILGMFLQIAALLIFKSYFVYCSVSLVCTLANNLIISRKADQMYPYIKRKVQLSTADKRDIFQNIKSMFIYKIATVAFKGTDSIFISAMISTAIVGKYSNYLLAVSNLSLISLLVFSSLSPSIGNLIAKEPQKKRMEVFNVMQTVNFWLVGIFAFCLFFLLDEFVILWVGRDFVFSKAIKIAMLVEFYLAVALYPIIAFREATGIYQKTKYAMVVAAVLKITFSIVLGNRLGLIGIMLATTISKLLTYAWYEPKVLFRDYLGGKVLKYLLGHALNLLLITSCILITYYCFPWRESSSWFEWIIKGVVYTFAINAIYFIRYFKTHEFKVIKEKVRELLKKAKAVK